MIPNHLIMTATMCFSTKPHCRHINAIHRSSTHIYRVWRMAGMCVSRAAVRVRVRSPMKHYKKDSSFIGVSSEISDLRFNKYLPHSESSNRIMVVVDPNHETKGAMEWALSHTVQSQDTVILLHIATKGGKANDKRAYNLLEAMKNLCKLRRSEVRVEIAVREGKEKGRTIVEAAKQGRASVLVLGQRKQSFLRRLQIWNWKRKRISGNRVVDYCIQNAACVAIAVRPKNRKYGGGYLITTKRHKNFWLLA